MDNILPKFKSFSLDEPEKVNMVSHWIPAASKPPSKKAPIPYYLEDAFTKDPSLLRGEVKKQDILPPNERYLAVVYDSKDDPSPLSLSQRGVVEETKITIPNIDLPRVQDLAKSSSDDIERSCNISFHNCLSQSIEFFYQNHSDNFIQSFTVESNQKYNRLLNVIKNSNVTPTSASSDLSIFLVSSRKITVRLSSFQPGPIGMEVEIAEGRLLCCKVFEKSQASQYVQTLRGSEIISVNNTRVITLEEFENIIFESRKRNIPIIIQAIVTRPDYAIPPIPPPPEISPQRSSVTAENIESKNGVRRRGMLAGDSEIISRYGSRSKDDDDEQDGDDDDDSNNDGNSSDDSSDFGLKYKKKRKGNMKANNRTNAKSVITTTTSTVHSPGGGGETNGNNIATTTVMTMTLLSSEENFDSDEVNKNANYDSKKSEGKNEKVVMDNHNSSSNHNLDEDSLFTSKRTGSVQSTVEDPGPDWRYTTAGNSLTETPYLSLVCSPLAYKSRQGWGNPDKLMLIANFSKGWDIMLFWVSSSGYLVPRAKLRWGDRHSEYTSTSHVWCVIGVPSSSSTARARSKAGNTIMDDWCSDWNDSDVAIIGDASLDSSIALLLKPDSVACLQDTKTCSLLWVPNASVTATFRPRILPAHTKSKIGEPKLPHLSLQILDSSQSL